LARPDLKVIVTMGDGGLGIGGAHVLSTCRRNIDLTLLVLNNFNYGMTGGQCSSTTPVEAQVGSGFLNSLEKPLDICQVAGAAGAGLVARVSTYDKNLIEMLKQAITFEGFALLDIWGICPGRYTRFNKLTPKIIAEELAKRPDVSGFADQNARAEYGRAYRKAAAGLKPEPDPVPINARCTPPGMKRAEVVLLGSAGQRILTAGELLCLAGASAGLHATQKNDYPITVMRGHSVSEIILSETKIDYTGIENPTLVIALAQEGVNRRKAMLAGLSAQAQVIKAAGLDLGACRANMVEVDFKAQKIRPQDMALASLAVCAGHRTVLTTEMLETAVKLRFNQRLRETAMAVIKAMA
jgi:Pyruvate/2-oxoacid:ferredoxin oxidoreductase gamma subunit